MKPLHPELAISISSRLIPFAFRMCAIVLLAVAPSQAATVWNEATNGDISNNRLAPTSVTLSLAAMTSSGRSWATRATSIT